MKKHHKLYVLPDFIVRKEQTDRALWMSDPVIAWLVVGLSALDGVTLFTVFDTVMYQSQIIGILITTGCALTLNFIPLVMARYIHLYRYRLNGVQRWHIVLLALVFAILFGATFYLRWETRSIGLAGAESTMLDRTGQAAGLSTPDSSSRQAAAVTILLGILPFITSALNLALGYLNDDPVQRKLVGLKHQRALLDAHINCMYAAHEELDQDWAGYLNRFDDSRLRAAQDEITAGSEHICALARHQLAQKLGDPDSISWLTEPATALKRAVRARPNQDKTTTIRRDHHEKTTASYRLAANPGAAGGSL